MRVVVCLIDPSLQRLLFYSVRYYFGSTGSSEEEATCRLCNWIRHLFFFISLVYGGSVMSLRPFLLLLFLFLLVGRLAQGSTFNTREQNISTVLESIARYISDQIRCLSRCFHVFVQEDSKCNRIGTNIRKCLMTLIPTFADEINSYPYISAVCLYEKLRELIS